MGSIAAIQNFVFVAAALVSGAFLALLVYGYRKNRDFDNPA
jgi:hypothetical protein